MRFANHDNRLTLITTGTARDLAGTRGIDVHRASGGGLPADPDLALERWGDVVEWAASAESEADVTIDPFRLGAPSPRPRQILGIGVNYAEHGAEAGMERPEVPLVFTKLSGSITGPFAEVPLSGANVDWEVELVVIIGREARAVAKEEAWSYVAGVTGGQDISDREVQWRPKATPQFSLGKSLPGFAPLGPLLVTVDEFADPDDIELGCWLNGEEIQSSRSSQMLFSVGELIAYLTAIVPLFPGDVIFTGTPSGIGMTRTPPRYLSPGDRLESFVGGVGAMTQTFAAAPTASLDHMLVTDQNR